MLSLIVIKQYSLAHKTCRCRILFGSNYFLFGVFLFRNRLRFLFSACLPSANLNQQFCCRQNCSISPAYNSVRLEFHILAYAITGNLHIFIFLLVFLLDLLFYEAGLSHILNCNYRLQTNVS